MAVARHRRSSPSSLIATARLRARPRTMTTDSTTPSRGSHVMSVPSENVGRVATWPLAWRARVLSTTRLSRCRYTSSVTQREICSRSRAPARISITQRVRFSMSGSGVGSDAVGVGCWPKYSSVVTRSLGGRCVVAGAGTARGVSGTSIGSAEATALTFGSGRVVHPRLGEIVDSEPSPSTSVYDEFCGCG